MQVNCGHGTHVIPTLTSYLDHTNDIAAASLKFDTSAYGENVNDTASSNAGCTYTIFGPDSGPIAGQSSPYTYRAGTFSNTRVQTNLAPSVVSLSAPSG